MSGKIPSYPIPSSASPPAPEPQGPSRGIQRKSQQGGKAEKKGKTETSGYGSYRSHLRKSS